MGVWLLNVGPAGEERKVIRSEYGSRSYVVKDRNSKGRVVIRAG